MLEGELRKGMSLEDMEILKRRAETTTGHKVQRKKVSKIGLYTRTGLNKWANIEEGKFLDPRISGVNNDEVAAIFKTEADYYVVCTENHGVSKGHPFIFRHQEIYMVVEE
ncbi:MAG: hypothetical protein HQL30_11080 [Candidatus Omnitrophica bacterium]|nr:hypothetical protein [Candidatus Omnitrophota bacterium]